MSLFELVIKDLQTNLEIFLGIHNSSCGLVVCCELHSPAEVLILLISLI